MVIESVSSLFRLSLLSILLFGAVQAEAEVTSVDGKMVAVTVFQGQALVTREIDLPDAKGLIEVIVKDLPEQILTGSLYAEPADGVEIRSVRFRVRPIEGDSREEVREIDEQIKKNQEEQRELGSRHQLTLSRQKLLVSMENFTTSSGKSDLQRGVLDSVALIDIAEYSFKRREEVAKQLFIILESQRELKEKLQQLQQKRNVLTVSSETISREAVVFLSAGEEGASFRVSYLVSGANWTPSYNLRANADQSEVTIEYNASVKQTSGEDWTDVAMTLSTASPSFAAKAPSLLPFEIQLAAQKPQPISIRDRSRLLEEQKSLASSRWSGMVADGVESESFSEMSQIARPNSPSFGMRLKNKGGGGGGGFGGSYAQNQINLKANDDALNRMANSIELFDLNNTLQEKPARNSKASVPQFEEGMSVVYKLANETSLPSRPDTQLIQIASLPVKAESYRIALPVLTKFVYQEAKLVNNTDMVLLAGPAATFLEDRFVGRGEVPSVAMGQSFTVGLGIDESFRVSRELVEKSERLQGANRIVTYNYDLTIENFSDQEVAVRLLDRMPTAKKDEIKIALTDTSKPLSEDEDYRRKEYEEGILRWDLTTPAKAIGKERVSVAYSVQMEHDKNLLPVDAKKK